MPQELPQEHKDAAIDFALSIVSMLESYSEVAACPPGSPQMDSYVREFRDQAARLYSHIEKP